MAEIKHVCIVKKANSNSSYKIYLRILKKLVN